MPFGIGIGQVTGLVREARALEGAAPWVSVSGPGEGELAEALAAGGDSGATRIDGNPSRAAVAIRVLDADPTPAEQAELRWLTRDGTPVIVVRRGGSERVPYVLPENVLDSGREPPLTDLADAIARIAAHDAPSLAARLPLLRPPVARRLIATTALANATLAASSRPRQGHLPLLTLAQGRMLLLLGAARGDSLPRDPQDLAVAAGPPLAAALGLGLGARALVRRLPLDGPLLRAAVAYAGTRALGAARVRLGA